LKRTPLYGEHVALGARMVPFGGWEMPVQYEGVIEEHKTVRTKVGLFDVSHMGEIVLRGPRALEVANRIITNDLAKAVEGQAVYAAMCRPDGGIVDDVVAYRFGSDHIFICVNASNRDKDFAWIKDSAKGDCSVANESDEWAQIAIQGPRAVELIARLTDVDLSKIGTYRFATGKVNGAQAIVSRTGYTGEDGFELYVAAKDGPALWRALLEKGKDFGVKAAGLGARDSLRLEMKFALYGNDIDDSTNPLEAGLGWTVKFDKGDFTGRAVLEKIKAEGPKRKLVGFQMIEPGIARHGYPVFQAGAPAEIGTVTSGTMGPSVGKAIGLAYVPATLSAVGSAFEVGIRNKHVKAEVVKTPFYQRSGSTKP
jgi:aminomethyltransferase